MVVSVSIESLESPVAFHSPLLYDRHVVSLPRRVHVLVYHVVAVCVRAYRVVVAVSVLLIRDREELFVAEFYFFCIRHVNVMLAIAICS